MICNPQEGVDPDAMHGTHQVITPCTVHVECSNGKPIQYEVYDTFKHYTKKQLRQEFRQASPKRNIENVISEMA